MSNVSTAATTSAITEIQTIADTILETVQAVDPAVADVTSASQSVIDLLAELAAKALTAWSDAAGVPITQESVMALLPDATPLPPPTN